MSSKWSIKKAKRYVFRYFRVVNRNVSLTWTCVVPESMLVCSFQLVHQLTTWCFSSIIWFKLKELTTLHEQDISFIKSNEVTAFHSSAHQLRSWETKNKRSTRWTLSLTTRTSNKCLRFSERVSQLENCNEQITTSISELANYRSPFHKWWAMIYNFF